jgi:hypothetical protein
VHMPSPVMSRTLFCCTWSGARSSLPVVMCRRAASAVEPDDCRAHGPGLKARCLSSTAPGRTVTARTGPR